MEDLLYEMFYNGLYDEVMQKTKELREKDPYSDFDTLVKKAYEIIKKKYGGVA